MAKKKGANPFEEYQAQFLDMWNENLSKLPGGDVVKKYQDQLADAWQKGIESIPGAGELRDRQEQMIKTWQASLEKLPGADMLKGFQDQLVDAWRKGADLIPSLDGLQDFWKGGLSAPSIDDLQRYQNTIIGAWKDALDNIPDADAVKAYQDQIIEAWQKALEKVPGAEALKSLQDQVVKAWREGIEKIPGADALKDVQEQIVDGWKKGLDSIPRVDAYKDAYEAMMPGKLPAYDMSEYWKMFGTGMPGMGEYWKSVSAMMPDTATFLKAAPYKIPGFDNYAKMFELWQGMNDPVTFAQDFQQKYLDLMQDLFKNFLPEGASQLMEQPMKFMDTLVGYYNANFAPMLKVDDKIMSRIASGDLTAYTDFFREFNEKYEDTIGKYYNMMGLGLNRESNEDVMKAMSAYNKAMFATGELMSLVMTTTAESGTILAGKFQDLIKDGELPSTFREFYDLWSSTTEAELPKLLDTDEFAKTFDNFADMYSQYMIANNKVLERMLANLPIPTNTDMKSLYKTVYELRKDVRDLKREIRDLKKSAKK